MMLSKTAIAILRKRYLLKDSRGKVIESPEQMLRRAAREAAKAEKPAKRKKIEDEFFGIMKSLDFLPNSPALMNSGTKMPQLSACFVLPIEDSMESIFRTLEGMAMIHQSGGGVGFSFSHIRPEGDIVETPGGVASGPVSFIHIFDKATEVIKEGGRRRGANMGVLDASHPDIFKFIRAKEKGGLANFNLSVAVTDRLMESAKKGGNFELVNPRTKKAVKKVKASKIVDAIAESAWASGDPGVVFIDEINRKHPLREKIEATNPCGEQPLLPYESCTLGSINLSNMASKNGIDWERLGRAARIAVRMLDNLASASKAPIPEIRKVSMQNRKIGLGVMGFAEMLIKLGIKYDSEDAVKAAEEVMRFISSEGREASMELGKEKGSFPNFRKSRLAKKYSAMRNAAVTTIAPTGTISIIAGTSSGIEPLFAVKYSRNAIGMSFDEENALWKSGRYDKSLFVTAMEISPEQHVKVQAAFQRHTDNAVSKTVNLPASAPKADARNAFMLAYELGCKGITVYRHMSKPGQVLKICMECD